MKVSPTVESIAKYREHDDSDWKITKVLGRGGKVSRKYASFYNIEDITSNDFEQLTHWQTEDNKNVLISTSKNYHLDHAKQFELFYGKNSMFIVRF